MPRKTWVFPLLAALLLTANACIWVAVGRPPERVLRVSVLDVGQGDAILIQGPTGRTMLIDGGPDRTVLRRLGEELGPLERSIDVVVETHPDGDHINGLPGVFNNYDIGAFMEPGFPPATAVADELQAAWQAEPGLRHIVARRGLRIALGGGAYADILSPDRDPSKGDTNDGSVVLHLSYGNTSFMLVGDLPSTHENWLARLDAGDGELPATVLKAGHHGSKTSTDETWLTAVKPAIVAISAGKDNQFGHPSPETLERIAAAGSAPYSTIDSGTLHFVSGGERVVMR